MKKIHYIYTVLLLIGYLGIHQGNIAFWNNNQNEPAIIYPYRAALFPDADQQALQNRIPLSSQEVLNRLLEDYLS